MNIIGFMLLPLGCIIVIGAVIGVAWELKRMDPDDDPADSMSAQDEIKTVFQKYTAHILSPIGLALILYLLSFIPILLMPLLGDFGMLFLFAIIMAFTGFSAISPIINLFQPRWWLNTALYIASWFLLFYGLIGTLSWRAGEDMSVAAIGFGPAMLVAFFILPITALIKLVQYLSRRSQHHTPGQL